MPNFMVFWKHGFQAPIICPCLMWNFPVLFNRNTFLAQSKLVQKLTFTNSVPKMVKRSSLKKILNQKMTKSICDESAYILLSIVSLKPYFPKCLTHKPKKTKMFHTWHISPSVFKVCKKVSKNNKIFHQDIGFHHSTQWPNQLPCNNTFPPHHQNLNLQKLLRIIQNIRSKFK